ARGGFGCARARRVPDGLRLTALEDHVNRVLVHLESLALPDRENRTVGTQPFPCCDRGRRKERNPCPFNLLPLRLLLQKEVSDLLVFDEDRSPVVRRGVVPRATVPSGDAAHVPRPRIRARQRYRAHAFPLGRRENQVAISFLREGD